MSATKDLQPHRLRVYDAECALHAAHQSGVDGWMVAAREGLHRALVALAFAEGRGDHPDSGTSRVIARWVRPSI
jgi:hypothetical protein